MSEKLKVGLSKKTNIIHTSPSHYLETDDRVSENAVVENKPRLPYVKRTRIQYTMQQVSLFI